MPNPHFDLAMISRSGGSSIHASAAYTSGSKLHSVLATAAYRSGEALQDERTGTVFDYTRKEDVLHTEILAPGNAPAWATDRQSLWNHVEAAEKRKDAQLARSIIAGLPRELTAEQNIAFVRDFVQTHFVAKGMIADVAVHDKEAADGGRNPHVHILLTLREISPQGFAATKNRDWNLKYQLYGWREAWETIQNRHLEAAGSNARVSLQSYEERGMHTKPQEHMGYEATALERKGTATDKGKRNRKTRHQNAVRDVLQDNAPGYTAADSAAFYDKVEKRYAAIYAPANDHLEGQTIRQAAQERPRRTQREYYAQRVTTQRWFGLGSRETHTYLPGMATLPSWQRAELDRTTTRISDETLRTAWLEHHRKSVIGVLFDNSSGGPSAVSQDRLQRMTRWIRSKATAALEHAEERIQHYNRWIDRVQRDRNSGWEPER